MKGALRSKRSSAKRACIRIKNCLRAEKRVYTRTQLDKSGKQKAVIPELADEEREAIQQHTQDELKAKVRDILLRKGGEELEKLKNKTQDDQNNLGPVENAGETSDGNRVPTLAEDISRTTQSADCGLSDDPLHLLNVSLLEDEAIGAEMLIFKSILECRF